MVGPNPAATRGHDLAIRMAVRRNGPGSRASLLIRLRPVLAAQGASGDRYAMILPGASCPSRRYPPERFARVAELVANSGLRVVVVGTAEESALVEDVAAAAPGAVGLAGRLDVPVLAAAVSASSVVVCNNSGGAHLASATGTPVVVLFAGTEQVEQYEPRGVPAAVLTVSTACSPCRQFACPYALQCLDVVPAQVAQQALRLAVS